MEKEKLLKLAKNLLSARRISDHTGINYETIRYLLTKNQISIKKIREESPKKYCAKCDQFLPKKQFYPKGRTSWCKPCHKKSTTNTWRNVKKQAVEYKGGKCEKCGYNKCVAAFDFHDRDPAKKEFSLSSTSRTFASIKAELDKCSLLCSNCHRELHHNESN